MFEELVTFATSVLAIAACSIGIQAIGELPDEEDRTTDEELKASNKHFLVILLVVAIFMLLISAYFLYSSFKK